MNLSFLGKGGSDNDGGCPSLYASDRGTYIVQGWDTHTPEVIEIPHLLLGFARPDTFIGAIMTDTGRGTFTLSGALLTDCQALAQMDIRPGEAAIEVSMTQRQYYGNPTTTG